MSKLWRRGPIRRISPPKPARSKRSRKVAGGHIRDRRKPSKASRSFWLVAGKIEPGDILGMAGEQRRMVDQQSENEDFARRLALAGERSMAAVPNSARGAPRAIPDRRSAIALKAATPILTANSPALPRRPNNSAGAVAQIVEIMAAQRFVAESGRRIRAGAAPGRRGAPACRAAAPRLRARTAFRPAACAGAITASIAARPPERARSSGSCPSGSSAKRRLLPGADQRQGGVDRAESRLAPGLVAVETEDRLLGHLPQQLALVRRQGGAERRDGIGESRPCVMAMTST